METEAADSVVGQEELGEMAKTPTSLLETYPTLLTDLPENILRSIFQVIYSSSNKISRCSEKSRCLFKFTRVENPHHLDADSDPHEEIQIWIRIRIQLKLLVNKFCECYFPW